MLLFSVFLWLAAAAHTRRGPLVSARCPLLGGWDMVKTDVYIRLESLRLQIGFKTLRSLALYSLVEKELLWNTYIDLDPAGCHPVQRRWKVLTQTHTDKLATTLMSEFGASQRYLSFLNNMEEIELSPDGKFLYLTTTSRATLVFERNTLFVQQPAWLAGE
eukprot:Gregarina_sp_Pseudo_9__5772@NODE_859_length_2124_cov_40_721343_g807_i0_p2_GENE_NODE_859_length_2124_cov_40_721343_g807_i0NODE_859_length_2124_cov_40_721343_g807_i0_p2_ORF_typecomplete_len161_score33_51Lactonase/PF10282_9/0_029META/PF03724_16/0_1_NODE_859_length_2124_cov_40_721343_g807_i010351517